MFVLIFVVNAVLAKFTDWTIEPATPRDTAGLAAYQLIPSLCNKLLPGPRIVNLHLLLAPNNGESN